MLIPLGILASSGGAAGSYELIETALVGSGGQVSVTFSNLGNYSSTYQHLQLRGVARSTHSDTVEWLFIKFNSSNLTNRHELRGDGSSVFSEAGLIGGETPFILAPAANATSNIFAGFVTDILDPYETTKNKTIRTLAGAPSNYNEVQLVSAFWDSTSAISSITVEGRNGNLAQYSRLSLYGLKGA